MPKAARRTSGPQRTEPYTKPPPKKDVSDKENVDPELNPNAPQSDWRDIPLDEVKGEVPCYEQASAVRSKLNRLIRDKVQIPGTTKRFSQASMEAEMQQLLARSHVVPCQKNGNNPNPSARALGNFLKRSGQMGGGDSPAYYWGYVMLEKMRIDEGKKKSKARLEAEQK